MERLEAHQPTAMPWSQKRARPKTPKRGNQGHDQRQCGPAGPAPASRTPDATRLAAVARCRRPAPWSRPDSAAAPRRGSLRLPIARASPALRVFRERRQPPPLASASGSHRRRVQPQSRAGSAACRPQPQPSRQQGLQCLCVRVIFSTQSQGHGARRNGFPSKFLLCGAPSRVPAGWCPLAGNGDVLWCQPLVCPLQPLLASPGANAADTSAAGRRALYHRPTRLLAMTGVIAIDLTGGV